jgi:hypothetical protein
MLRMPGGLTAGLLLLLLKVLTAPEVTITSQTTVLTAALPHQRPLPVPRAPWEVELPARDWERQDSEQQALPIQVQQAARHWYRCLDAASCGP